MKIKEILEKKECAICFDWSMQPNPFSNGLVALLPLILLKSVQETFCQTC